MVPGLHRIVPPAAKLADCHRTARTRTVWEKCTPNRPSLGKWCSPRRNLVNSLTRRSRGWDRRPQTAICVRIAVPITLAPLRPEGCPQGRTWAGSRHFNTAPIGPFRAHATLASASAVGGEALIRTAIEPWAILRRHPLGLKVGKHSVNPCLVAAAQKVISGRDLQIGVPKG